MTKQLEQTHDGSKAFPNKGDYGDYIIYKAGKKIVVREGAEITADTPVHVCFTGWFGDVDAKTIPETQKETVSKVINYTYAENPDFKDIVIVVDGSGNGGDAYDRAAEVDGVIRSIEEENGVMFKHITSTGSSSGDVYATKFFAYEAMNGRENMTLGITGAGTFGRSRIPGATGTRAGDFQHWDPNGAFFTEEEAEAVVASNSNVIMVERGNKKPDDIWAPENYTTVRQMNEQGIYPTIFHYKGDDHIHLANVPIKEGLFNFYDYDEDAVRHFIDNYRPVRFNPTTGSYESVSYDSYMSGANTFSLSSFNYADFLPKSDYNIETFDKESAYSSLKNIGDIGISYLKDPSLQSKLHDETIVSDLGVVSDYMTQIRNSIKSSSAAGSHQGFSFGGSGAGGMLGCIMGYIDAYYNAVGALMSALTAETDSITSFAQAYADMDADFENKAGNIMAMDVNGNMSKLDLSAIEAMPRPSGGNASASGAPAPSMKPEATPAPSGSEKVENPKPVIETERHDDGSYETRITNKDGSQIVTNYDSDGKVIDSKVVSAGAASAAGAAASAEPEATPEPTSSPAPSVKPEVTPSPAPSREPEATPAPTPSPAPSREPEATPEPTPSPAPSRETEPTPEPTPSPAPSERPGVVPVSPTGENVSVKTTKDYQGNEVTTYTDNTTGKVTTETRYEGGAGGGSVETKTVDPTTGLTTTRIDYNNGQSVETVTNTKTGKKVDVTTINPNYDGNETRITHTDEKGNTSHIYVGKDKDGNDISFELPSNEENKEVSRTYTPHNKERTITYADGHKKVEYNVQPDGTSSHYVETYNDGHVVVSKDGESYVTTEEERLAEASKMTPLEEARHKNSVDMASLAREKTQETTNNGQETVEEPETIPAKETQPDNTNNESPRRSGGAGGYSGGGYVPPSPAPSDNSDVKPTPEVKPEPTPEVKPEPTPEVKPTPTPSYTPSYNPSPSYTPAREEDTSSEVIDDIPYVTPDDVVPEPDVTPEVKPEPVAPTNKGSNAGKVWGTLAGLAAAGAGAAGIAYTANKMKEEKENEGYEDEYNDEEEVTFDEDKEENNEINLSDDI